MLVCSLLSCYFFLNTCAVKEIKGKKIEGTSGVASRKRTEEESILIQLEPKEKEEHQAISSEYTY